MAEDKEVQEAPKKGGGSKIILLVGLVALANLGATAFGLLQIVELKSIAAQPAVAQPEPTDEEVPIIALEPFVVNLNEPGSARYLKIVVSVSMASARAAEAFEQEKVAIRDELLSYLSDLSISDTQGASSKTTIKAQLAARIEDILGRGSTQRLFLKEFVIQ